MQHVMGGYPRLGVDVARSGENATVAAFLERWTGSGKRSGGAGYSVMDRLMDRVVSCPWPATTGSVVPMAPPAAAPRRPLYSPQERIRRDATRWTTVQGVLAPVQFLVFLISLGLVLNFLATGRGYEAATISIVAKTLVLYTIMITGAIW